MGVGRVGVGVGREGLSLHSRFQPQGEISDTHTFLSVLIFPSAGGSRLWFQANSANSLQVLIVT